MTLRQTSVGPVAVPFPNPAWWTPGLGPPDRTDAPAPTGRPTWVDTVEQAVLTACPTPLDAVPADWRAALAVPLRPFVTAATSRLVIGAAGRPVDLPMVTERFARALGEHLVDLSVATMVAELHGSTLSGVDSRARFADFVAKLTEPAGLAALWTAYPVLARCVGQAAEFAGDAVVELLDRFAADRAEIVATLFHGADPGPLTAIDSGHGDAHRRGRSVTVLAFADGSRLVYRPRDVGPHLRFAELLGWLNGVAPGLDLRAVAVLARPDHGWLEHIDFAPLADRAGADRFYRRQGALLALLHAVYASDIHYENLIACGDQPVLVDVETLFHPSLPAQGAATDPAVAALADSVHRTAMLPLIVVGDDGVIDVSGLGGDGSGVSPLLVTDWELAGTDEMRSVRRPREFAGARNRPMLDDRFVDPGEHESATLDGFRCGYDAITRHRAEFADLVRGCADTEVRVVFRPTRSYTALLAQASRPELFGDGAAREAALDVLRADSVADPVRARLVSHELTDLWAGDVPLFTGRPAELDVWSAEGCRIPDLLDRSGLSCALERIAGMGEVDRRDQEWIIAASLATRRPATGHGDGEPTPGPVAGTAPHPERLLAAACAIGDQLVARSMSDGNRANWLGLELVDDRQWLVLPMGAGLATGYTGVALYLAQLARLSDIGRYAELALAALAPMPALLDSFAERPELIAAIGTGGLHGFGGIAYALARLTTLLDLPQARTWAATAVGYAARADPEQPGWVSGDAGCLAAMLAVHAELGLPAAADLARGCAERLVGRGADKESGFADGAAGIEWALATHTSGAVVPSTVDVPGRGWCHGAAGLALAASRHDPDVDLGFVDGPVLRDLSLCHGELGVTDVLATLAADGHPQAAPTLRKRAGLVLDALDRYGPGCGTPGGVPTPGLLNGLAGIGYGLLRLGFADRVPSVLLLQSPNR